MFRNAAAFLWSLLKHPFPSYRGPSTREKSDYIYKGQLYWQGGVDAEMAEFDGPFVGLSLCWAPPLRFTCEFEVGGEVVDCTFRVKLPLLPKVAVTIGNVARPLGLRKAAHEWASRRAPLNFTYAHELDPFEGRVTGVSFFDDMLTFSLWSNVNSRSSGAFKTWPWLSSGWCKSFFVWDILFGAWELSERQLGCTTCSVMMPEDTYSCTVKLDYKERSRPRTWGVEKWVMAEVTFPEGKPLPIPGKGENSYDCEDDAIYSSSVKVEGEAAERALAGELAHAVIQAVSYVKTNALATRRKRAGPNWVPSWLRDEPEPQALSESAPQALSADPE